MVYARVLNRGVLGIKSSADLLFSQAIAKVQASAKLWPSLACHADPSIMVGRTRPFLEKLCGAVYFRYLRKPGSG